MALVVIATVGSIYFACIVLIYCARPAQNSRQVYFGNIKRQKETDGERELGLCELGQTYGFKWTTWLESTPRGRKLN